MFVGKINQGDVTSLFQAILDVAGMAGWKKIFQSSCSLKRSPAVFLNHESQNRMHLDIFFAEPVKNNAESF